MQIVIYIIFGLILLYFLRSLFFKIRVKYLNDNRDCFNFQSQINSFSEATPVFHNNSNKVNKGVLFLHGFSASPGELSELYDSFIERGYSIYAPAFTGFGLNDIHLLESINESDWLRDAYRSYEVLEQISGEINVVAHSMGGLIALLMAQEKKINTLILSAPYTHVKDRMEFNKKLLLSPITGALLTFLRPYIKKSSKKIYNPKRLVLNIVPVNAVKAIWRAQNLLDFTNIKANRIIVLQGLEDNTSEVDKLVAELNKAKQSFEVYKYQSGHNLLQDKSAKEVKADIIKFIESSCGTENVKD